MPKRPAHSTPADNSEAVDAYIDALTHPQKAEVEALRRLILGVDPSIDCGIKWNAPSFRTTEYFATMNLRPKARLRLVLHLGAKARALPEGGVSVEDPAGLLTWPSQDRAIVEIPSLEALADASDALRAILAQWLAYV